MALTLSQSPQYLALDPTTNYHLMASAFASVSPDAFVPFGPVPAVAGQATSRPRYSAIDGQCHPSEARFARLLSADPPGSDIPRPNGLRTSWPLRPQIIKPPSRRLGSYPASAAPSGRLQRIKYF